MNAYMITGIVALLFFGVILWAMLWSAIADRIKNNALATFTIVGGAMGLPLVIAVFLIASSIKH